MLTNFCDRTLARTDSLVPVPVTDLLCCMRILIIGGTSFIGPHLVAQLQSAGHHVTVFHRGQTDNLHNRAAAEILGDRKNIAASAAALVGVAPDVVVDMIPHSQEDAEGVLRVFSDSGARVVGISSGNVCHGFALCTRDAEGAVIPGALTEESPCVMTRSRGTTREPWSRCSWIRQICRVRS